ncbi:MAG: sigma-E processing peptidase SpoIIGA [Clostridiales bacterium]|nr:sigma-E processing peptidase SpoIIGA [Eubacteriales bacterium]MDH7564983.1 sigma-E processing peptidase SpoIIGA [Clostridiales bacterium]
MDIYLDVLFLENIVMNYLILLVTAKFSKTKTSNLRLFLGALIGAAYVVVLVVFPGMKVYYSTIAKVVLSIAIVAVVFSPEKIKAFLKTLAIFYISTFIFAGAALTFLYFFQSGGFIKNGIIYVYWQSKWILLFLSIVTVAIIIRAFWDVIQYRFIREKLLIPLKIIVENKKIDLSALVDTGNSLHDPLTDMPVVIVEFNAIREVLPQEIQNIFDQSKDNDLVSVTDVISNSRWLSRFRLIPYTSLGKENGMLIGFKPDYIEIGENREKKGVSDVIVGIYNRALSKNERYKALLGPELVG